MVDKQIHDAQEELIGLEDKLDIEGSLTAQEERKVERIKESISSYAKNYKPEDGHTHNGQ